MFPGYGIMFPGYGIIKAHDIAPIFFPFFLGVLRISLYLCNGEEIY
jgi:hypothetical protein